MRLIKRIAKILGILILSITGLLLLICFLVILPPVQRKIVSTATTYLEKKTKANIDIGGVYISFPLTVKIENIFVADPKGDSLLYAKEIKVNAALKPIFKGSFQIGTISLNTVNAYLKRTETDSLFNYQFLVNAFADSTKVPEPGDTTKKPLDLQINNVDLNLVHFLFDDRYSGTYANVAVTKMNLAISSMNLDEMKFDVSNLDLDQTAIKTIIRKKTESADTTASKLPVIHIRKLNITKTAVDFKSTPDSLNFVTYVSVLKLEDADANLLTNNFKLDQLSLDDSNIGIDLPMGNGKATVKDTTVKSKSPMVFSVNKIQLSNNNLVYNKGTRFSKIPGFDANHVLVNKLTTEINDLSYNGDSANVSIDNLSFNEHNAFEIRKLTADVSMGKNIINVKKLKGETTRSFFDIKTKAEFVSMEELQKNPGATILDILIKDTKINSDDLAYFSPQLLNQKSVKLQHQNVILDLDANGTVKNLAIKNLNVKVAGHTQLSLKGKVRNITDTKNLSYDIPALNFYTTRKDIYSIVKQSVFPADINLPSTILLKTSLSGNLKSVKTKLNLGTEIGGLMADGFFSMGKDTTYNLNLTVSDFNIARLMPSVKQAGKVSLIATVNGKGLSKEKLDTQFDVLVKEATFNNYTYHDAKVQGVFADQQFTGTAGIKDSNINFNFDGYLSLKPKAERYNFKIDLKGADLQALHFSTENIRVSAVAVADLSGTNIDNITGNAFISKLILVKDNETYVLDSTVFASINQEKKSDIKISSALIDIDFSGSLSPGKIKDALVVCINKFYNTGIEAKEEAGQQFALKITLHNHPIISKILLPGLTEFSQSTITADFDGDSKKLKVDFAIDRMVYQNQLLNDLVLAINTENEKLTVDFSIRDISSSSLKLNLLDLKSEFADNKGNFSLTLGPEDKRKLGISALLTPTEKNGNQVVINTPVTLDEAEWNIPVSNYLRFEKGEKIEFNDLNLNREAEEFAIQTSPGNKYKTVFAFREFEIEHFSRLLERDTALISGQLNGVLNMISTPGAPELNAEIELKNLNVYNTPIADLNLKADNSVKSGFKFELTLSGNENDVLVKGTVGDGSDKSAMNITADINNLNASTLEGLSLGALTKTTGKVDGKFRITGTTSKPEVQGNIHFADFTTTPKATKTSFHLDNEKIEVTTSAITFNSFTIKDYANGIADISGKLSLENFKPGAINLTVDTKNFRVFNTTIKDNKLYYGKLLLGGNIRVTGNSQLPVINASLRLNKESSFAFVVPESKLSNDKGEEIIHFEDTVDIDPILRKKVQEENSGLKGFEVTSRIQVDPEATLKVEIDPTTGDSLVVRGEAALSFSIDQSGKMSLTGLYELKDGSYVATLEALIHKKFQITSGSTIRWNGDPLDADVSIDAIYKVTTSAIDLVSNQVAGMSETERNQYKQRLDFEVYLQLRGQLLKPDISFKIELADKDKGALQGSVESKLKLLNEDQSELNKQVFALLLLNRFVQEDPLASDGSSTNSMARTSVSKFLTEELNNIVGRRIAGAELNFNVDSYEDYSSGEAEGRTQVGVDIKKNFFNDRFSVQVGGNVDVEGEAAQNNNMSELTGDVIIEYKITKDGRLRFSAFRRNQYEDVIEGQVTETGIGFLYSRDFNRWRQFFSNGRAKANNEKVQ